MHLRKSTKRNGREPISGCFLVIFLHLVCTAQSPEQHLAEKIVDLRLRNAQADHAFTEEEMVLNAEISLLQQRLKDAQTDLESATKKLTELTESLSETRYREQSLQREMEALQSTTDDTRIHLLEINDQLPGFAKRKLNPLYRDLSEAVSAEKLRTQAGLICEIMLELASLSNEIHTEPETGLGPDGKKREFKTLWLGLAEGFALTPTSAARYRNRKIVWQSALSNELEKAFTNAEKQTENASLPRLPLSTEGGQK